MGEASCEPCPAPTFQAYAKRADLFKLSGAGNDEQINVADHLNRFLVSFEKQPAVGVSKTCCTYDSSHGVGKMECLIALPRALVTADTFFWKNSEQPTRTSKFQSGNVSRQCFQSSTECKMCSLRKRTVVFKHLKPVAPHGAVCGFCRGRSLVFEIQP